MDTSDLATLPLTERLKAMETLWDSICRDAGQTFVSPSWHADVLAERTGRLDSGTELIADWADAKRRIRNTTGRE